MFHALFSSCSQKLRIVLNLKGIHWVSHPVDLERTENLSPYYLGINPRGLVPCLVHDGQVHIESNDIILYLEQTYPQPALVPGGRAEHIEVLLEHENDLHLDMRSVTFRFIFSRNSSPRMSADALARYGTASSGTVQGKKDPNIAREISYWEDYEAHGISDQAVRQAVERLRSAFIDLDRVLGKSPFIVGATLSVVDIAWLVYVHRLQLSGYPIARLHASLHQWYERLIRMPEVARELVLPEELEKIITARLSAQRSSAKDLETICGL